VKTALVHLSLCALRSRPFFFLLYGPAAPSSVPGPPIHPALRPGLFVCFTTRPFCWLYGLGFASAAGVFILCLIPFACMLGICTLDLTWSEFACIGYVTRYSFSCTPWSFWSLHLNFYGNPAFPSLTWLAKYTLLLFLCFLPRLATVLGVSGA
jgi:hypothetical protein